MVKKSEEEPFITNREIIRDMHTKVDRLCNIMLGDKEAGIKGVVHDVSDLKEAEKKRTMIYMLVAGISSGLSIAIKYLYEFLAIHK